MGRSRVDLSSAAIVTDAPEDDDWDISDFPSKDFPVERFFSELEEMMISGVSRFKIRNWAFSEYGVKKELLQKFAEMVRNTWAYAEQTHSESRMRRQNVRDKLELLFKETVREKRFDTALSVVNTLAELDGLKAPDINLTQNNFGIAGPPGTPQITNRTRERVAELMETMRLRQDQRAMKQEEDHERLLAAKSANTPKNGNGNGHG